MMRSLFPGIRFRLTMWYVSTIAILLLIFSMAAFFAMRITVLAQIEQDLDERISEAQIAIVDTSSHSRDDLHDLTILHPESLYRIDKNGITVLETPLWKFSGLDNYVQIKSLKKQWREINEHHYRIAQKILNAGADSYVIFAALDVTSAAHNLRLLAIIFIAGIPAALFLVISGGIILTDRLLKPVRDITNTAASITAHNLNERLPATDAKDEFGQLASVFNELFSRLNISFENLRRFTADASHELRTPLTAIRSVGETALQKALPAEGYREVIGSILEEVDRLRNLIESLLTLTRADANQIPLHPETLNLGDEVREVMELLGILAEEKGQEIVLTIQDTVFVVADHASLRQALINILDNAIKFTPDSGCIRISVSVTQKTAAEIRVYDQGPGIAKEDRPKIFNRFYRVDKSRIASSSGSGLGLAIAKWAVEINRGRIAIESEMGKGSCFIITLPNYLPDMKR